MHDQEKAIASAVTTGRVSYSTELADNPFIVILFHVIKRTVADSWRRMKTRIVHKVLKLGHFIGRSRMWVDRGLAERVGFEPTIRF